MKFIRILIFSLFFAPVASFGASSDFMLAAQLLAAAKSADIQQVQALVNNGANVNFVDSTGLSIVCTALMNNDVRAAQILQMYGADASNCDRQIKQYNNKNKAKGSGGLFSGLSSAQTLSLAAAGAAVVVGGLFLLTDVFDPGNDNDSSSSGGDRPNNNGEGGGTEGGGAKEFVSVAYGPAYLTPDGIVTSDASVYNENLLSWNPSAGGVREWDFNYFRPNVQKTNNFVLDGIGVPMQNYLLMMHGYSAFANGYMGQEIFRNDAHNPVKIYNSTSGGVPIVVNLITDDGISPTGSATRGSGISYAKSAAVESPIYLVDKYLNYADPTSASILGAEKDGFDLSGSGTAMNLFATPYDSALGKIVAGWNGDGRAYGDLFGFVPNGQLGIYRTGGGQAWIDVQNPTATTAVGTTSNSAGNAIAVGDTIVLNGVTYAVSSAVSDSDIITIPTIKINETTYKLPNETALLRGTCVGGIDECVGVSDVAIYKGIDGFYYVNSTGGDTIDSVYVLDSGNIYVQKTLQNADYKNFEAMYNARQSGNVIANVSLIDESRSASYLTVDDMPALIALNGGANTDVETFYSQITALYDRDGSDSTEQGRYAHFMFDSYGTKSPIIVMPAGEFAYGTGDGKSLSVKDAIFENYAPVLYDHNLEHMFMTVVAVQHVLGTDDADSIADYGNGTGADFGPLYLSAWQDANKNVYMSRKCGVGGLGVNGVDPWCFSAAGATSEMATASAAGAVASLQAAFPYMSNPQIFMLMALTADGYLLGTDASGMAFTAEGLATYLKSMYKLPPEYYEDTLSVDAYLDAFAEVYGYGMINLERATKPGTSIYFYDGNNIVSANGNAYWRAATNTVFRPSSALNLRGATIRTSFYDVLESVDGTMSMPRVWESEFALDGGDARGLYMGDVLGDFKTRRENAQRTQIGKFGFSMSMSERAYVDYMNGLDNLSFDYTDENWMFGASYQRYLTDGASRFNGMANPILGLASNAVVSDAEYGFGKWAFGGRVFSGAITDEGLLENDPTISAQYMPARLGMIQGAQSHIAWAGDKFSFTTALGVAHETDTLLGAQSDGLLNLGAGDTTYVDTVATYRVSDLIDLTARATFARTVSDAFGQFILGLDEIESNAFAFGANVGNFEFTVAQPLAISDGALRYAYADYEVVENADNRYELNVVDTRVENLSLRPDKREVRFTGAYRHNFGEFTDGAVGFIYRVNPNHTDEFGNESIFMMKLSHRLGI